jgi:UDP-N-acetylglucosamine 2-epimerase
VTLRENTERPEIVVVGANVLAGASAIEMLKATKQMLSQGDG